MSSLVDPGRVCRNCGGALGAYKTRYCSVVCLEAQRRNVNKSNKGRVPVGRHFLRSHDGAECVVCADARGLPYAEALRERGEVVGG